MIKTPTNYNLADRNMFFAKQIIDLSKKTPKRVEDIEIRKQLVRAGMSVGANYREADEAISRKDFFHRVRICLKETKECNYWLELISHCNQDNDSILKAVAILKTETLELIKIFFTIVRNDHPETK